MTSGQFTISWYDGHREPQCAPDPAYPNGKDIPTPTPELPSCKVDLPYPAKRCGAHLVTCGICGIKVACAILGNTVQDHGGGEAVKDRPKRKAIPIAVKRAVVARQGGFCKCGCGQPVSAWLRTNTCFDHVPALRLRDVNRRSTDYVPPQAHPDYIDALCTASHHAKTHGTGATTAWTDTGRIKKERRRNRPPKPKMKIRSRPFSKVHRPMRTKP